MSPRSSHESAHVELTSRVDAAGLRSRHDPEGARTELEQLVAIADSTPSPASSARARYALARVLVSLGAADLALELIEIAERDFRSVGEIDEAIRTNLGRMHVLDDLGRHADAAEVGRSMRSDLADRGTDDEIVWLRAAAEENTGVALGYIGRHQEALDAYASASTSYERLGLAADAARVLANRGVELIELARPAAAIDALERAHEQFVGVGDRLWQALCQTNLSQAWIAAGRYLDAFRCLDAAESSLAGLDHTTEWLRAQLARACCLESLHLNVEALDLYEELVEPMTEAGLVDDLGKVQLGRGTILSVTDTSSDEALDAFDAAIDAFQTSGDDPMLARAYLATAPLLAEPTSAIERAIALTSAADRPADLALAHLARAEQLERCDPTGAATSLQSARTLIEPLGVPALRWRLHHRTGRLLRLAGHAAGAQREFEAAIGALDTIRSSVDRDGIRQRFDGARGEAADDLIELLLDAGDAQAAFALSDSIRGRGLNERLSNETVAGVDTPPDELMSVYDRLLVARGPMADELAGRARVLERAASSASDVADAINPPRVGIAHNQIVFHTLGDEIVGFAADPRDEVVAIRKLGESGLLHRLLGQLDRQWQRFDHPDVVARHGDQLERATVDVLRRLHDMLLGPLLDHLSFEHPLTIVADGAIGAVPFAALHDGHRHVAERQAVRQTPSLAIDRHLQTRHRPMESVLAIGTDDPLAPLAAVETGMVGQIWDAASVVTGPGAVSSALFESAADHDIIHIAGHGLFRPDAPEFSAIRLADRWVTAAEIAQLRLDGQLIVLSTCNSGRRAVNLNMRETLGLPRAFLAAGAGGVIVNLWPADDRASADLMTTLHGHLAAGQPAVEALRTAQLDTMVRHPHPYYWGAATLIGGHDSWPRTVRPDRRRATT